jgi:hypothetical protein
MTRLIEKGYAGNKRMGTTVFLVGRAANHVDRNYLASGGNTTPK